MPIYEYVCKKCGHQQEALHKVDEKPRLACDACGAKPLSKLVSAAGFRLSGSGWYETDFKSDNKKNLAGDAAEVKPAVETPAKGTDDKPKAEPVKAETAKAEPAKPAKSTSPKSKSASRSSKRK
jgi:putative FmdB family regulatory protein